MHVEKNEVKKAIRRSQHCQRNWDLSREISAEDLEVFATAVSECPSKQNLAFYKVHFVTNRELIEKMHAVTDGFILNYETQESVTNPQVLANLVVIFEDKPVELNSKKDQRRNAQTMAYSGEDKVSAAEAKNILDRDANMAVGIAAGYLNLTANLMGYSTGCCACFDSQAIREILNLQGLPLLMMGVGFKDPDRNRLVHHLNSEFVFPTKPKQPIEVKIKA
ncbi:MAG TPA: nitroreductase family protein [Bdellovibrionales bacterium]|nr:nitroreductase family protein [Bdellovibrionales bacterium]